MYEAVIAGAGPAGGALAALLAEQGARVLLLDRERFPRYKACGGGIDGVARRALEAMGIDPVALQLDAPTEVCLTSGGRHPRTYRLDRPLAIMAMRADLDALIAGVAVERGAEFHDGERVRAASDDGRTVTVHTDRDSYQARVLIGADGVSSVVGRQFGLNRNPILYALLAAEVEVSDELQAFWRGRAQIDLSVWPLGYGWIFPKRSHLSIGTGAPARFASDLKVRFERFCQRSQLSPARTIVQRGHRIGFRRPREPLALDRVLLVGDAAGLVDPNTGGGIGPALHSSRLAAGTIVSYLAGETPNLRGYTALVERDLASDFHRARILRNTIVLRLLLTGGRATGHRSLWHEVIRVIRGEESYGDWYARSRLAPWLSWSNSIPL